MTIMAVFSNSSIENERTRSNRQTCCCSLFAQMSCLCRSPFIQPASYSILLYEQPCTDVAAGCYQHLHLAAGNVVAIMNGPNYAALLGFAQGNLVEISSYEASLHQAKQKDPQRKKFNPAFQFAPPKEDFPTFRMTANIPQVCVRLHLCAFWHSLMLDYPSFWRHMRIN